MTIRTKLSRPVAVLFAPLALLWAAPAAAQDQTQGEVSVQRFDPAPGPRNFFTTRSADTDGEMSWTAAAMVNYAFEPLVVSGATGARIPVVENMITGDVLGSFTIIPELQLGLKVPVSWVKGQGITDRGNPAPDGLDAVGLGDIQLEVKGRFYGKPGDVIVLGAYGYGAVPMGNLTASGSYIGNATASFGGAAIADGTLIEDITWAVNLGGMWREEAQLGQTTLGPELRWSVAGGYQIGPMIKAVVDAFGSTAFSGTAGVNNIELDAGAQITPLGSKFTISVGGGAGLLKGIGTPTARGFIGVLFNAETKDRDGDGITDDKDGCPDDPEDRDNYEDGDGCPDLDNDLDGLPDTADKCPNQPEDVDGFEDKDGCPDPDNDSDGIPDREDACPNEPETKNGFEDEDGCPDEKDTDKDGIPDSVDKCIDEAEDTDGFEDEDGCPDPDNDGDGIPDNQDECIDLPEDGKGKGSEKTDGCPIDA